jgi:hypothetical protein
VNQHGLLRPRKTKASSTFLLPLHRSLSGWRHFSSDTGFVDVLVSSDPAANPSFAQMTPFVWIASFSQQVDLRQRLCSRVFQRRCFQRQNILRLLSKNVSLNLRTLPLSSTGRGHLTWKKRSTASNQESSCRAFPFANAGSTRPSIWVSPCILKSESL